MKVCKEAELRDERTAALQQNTGAAFNGEATAKNEPKPCARHWQHHHEEDLTHSTRWVPAVSGTGRRGAGLSFGLFGFPLFFLKKHLKSQC